MRGYRWVIVTGIIEDHEQIALFDAAFEKTQYLVGAADIGLSPDNTPRPAVIIRASTLNRVGPRANLLRIHK